MNKVGVRDVRDVVSVYDDPVRQRNRRAHRRLVASASDVKRTVVMWVCYSFQNLG